MIPNEYEITSKNQFGTRNVRNRIKSLGELGAGETLEGGRQSQPFKSLYKNPLEIPKGIPS